MGKKKRKAYILDRKNGTVQIGYKVYQPCTGAVFHVFTKPPRTCRFYEVADSSMASAWDAINQDIESYLKGF